MKLNIHLQSINYSLVFMLFNQQMETSCQMSNPENEGISTQYAPCFGALDMDDLFCTLM